MVSKFEDRSALRVVVIEPSATIRGMLADAIRDLGVSKVQVFSSVKETVHFFEVELADWLVTTLTADKTGNAIQILKLVTLQPRLQKLRASLLLDMQTESDCLPLAFELGLLSYHPKSFVRESVTQDFEELFGRLKANDYNETMVAAEYIREYLKTTSDSRSRLALEENLLDFMPGSSKVLLSLAEAHFLNNNNELGHATLNQVELISPKQAPLCVSMRNRFNLATQQKEPARGKTPNN